MPTGPTNRSTPADERDWSIRHAGVTVTSVPTHPESTSPLLNEDEAAAYLRTTARQIKRYRLEGALPYVRIGRVPYVLRGDLDDFIQHRRVARHAS